LSKKFLLDASGKLESAGITTLGYFDAAGNSLSDGAGEAFDIKTPNSY
jgi:hypothetical protein